jgi:hypothetical protein
MKETKTLLYKSERKSAIKHPNRLTVSIYIEDGCSFEDKEYEMYFSGSCPWSDFEKIEEAIENDSLEDLIKKPFPTEENIDITLIEDGEWEDVHFWRYYVIETIESVEVEFTDEELSEEGTWTGPDI